MPPYKRLLCLGAALAVTACTTPADVSKPLSESGGDHNVHAIVAATPTGFTVDVRYKRYEMFPDITAILIPCRSAVIARAGEESKAQGREIVPLNEQDVRISTGHDAVLGFTKCRAFAEVKWR